MIFVQAPSRLHFGLLNRGSPNDAGRQFGGAGLMVEQPGLCLSTQPAATWSAEGPLAARVLAFARRFADALPAGALSPQRLVVERAPPEHVGLGTGTQLGMAVGRALAEAAGLKLSAQELATRVGRGNRSGLGVHGFDQGGFLVDGGKTAAADVAPLVARMPFPEDWRVLIVIPAWPSGRHGTDESQAFQQLQKQPHDEAATDRLCRLVLLGMLPALIERDVYAFGQALHEFNATSGALFASVQGLTYADARIGQLVAALRQRGVPGVGQSSWGPAVFAVVDDPERARALAAWVREHVGLAETDVIQARGCNSGAQVGQSDPEGRARAAR